MKIHHFISQIKIAIEESALEEHKKNSLYNKLNEFASEVDKSRTGWQSGMALYVAVCSAIGEGVQKLEPARKWVDSIAELLGKAKEAEDSMPRLPHTERKKLEPPRKQISSKKEEPLDDEIPF
ncbi:MAG: hypothetical protein ACK502_03515 [Alphaproteobacteria bacterium]